MEKASITSKKAIRQPYRITMAQWDYSVVEKRILTRVISGLQTQISESEQGKEISQMELFRNQSSFIEVAVSINDLVVDSANYFSVRKTLEELCRKEVHMILPAVKGRSSGYPKPELVISHLFTGVELKKNSRTVTIKIAKSIAKELINAENGLTKISDDVLFATDNKYVIKFYELICQFRDQRQLEYSVTRFRAVFCLHSKYIATKDLIKRVIRPAEIELQSIGDIHFTFSSRTRKKQVTGFIFKIVDRTKLRRELEAMEGYMEYNRRLLDRFLLTSKDFDAINEILYNPDLASSLRLKIVEIGSKIDGSIGSKNAVRNPSAYAVESILNFADDENVNSSNRQTNASKCHGNASSKNEFAKSVPIGNLFNKSVPVIR